MYCNGALSAVVSTRTCTVPLSSLQATPYNLVFGDHVNVIVVATNEYGSSDYSAVGNGATIWLVPDAPQFLENNAELTSATTIALKWSEGASRGGTEILDYRVWYTIESEDAFVELESGVLYEYYSTGITLTPGVNYKFKVQARNAVGFGAFSSELVVRSASVPEEPAFVTTAVFEDTVVISWTVQYDGGSPILSYQILILQSDNESFSEDLVNCDGTDATIIANTQCTISISGTLKTAPYSLPWGSSVWAKVKATNIVGSSEFSVLGNGALILTVPPAPQTLSNNVAVTNKDQIGLNWYEGPNTSGAAVQDYRVWYKIEDDEYTILETDIVDTTYIAKPLVAGTTYTFKVQARNSQGYGDFSNEVTVLVA